MEVSAQDVELLIRDKYDGDRSRTKEIEEDVARLAAGEPLAYVIGWIPFLGLRISLSSHPLIPRPETEWWTEKLITHLREKFGDSSFSLLDLCAGSGAIGLAVLHELPHAKVCFSELMPEHVALIKENLRLNNLDASRAAIFESNLFEFSTHDLYNVVATNPPYIPEDRTLDESVTSFEPREALFSGPHGMKVITKILSEVSAYLMSDGEVWMECDISNIKEAEIIARAYGARTTTIHADHSGRPRLLVSEFT